MSALDPPCLRGKDVFLSKPRSRKNPDGTLIVEVDLDLDVKVTCVFSREGGPIAFCGAFRDVYRDERVHRIPYTHELPRDIVSVATDYAIDACAEHDREPPTERDPAPRGTS